MDSDGWHSKDDSAFADAPMSLYSVAIREVLCETRWAMDEVGGTLPTEDRSTVLRLGYDGAAAI